VDWWIFRVATSELFRASPREVRGWGLPDVLAAHAVLDEHDAILEEARRKSERG
jgi:hypothetical protein